MTGVQSGGSLRLRHGAATAVLLPLVFIVLALSGGTSRSFSLIESKTMVSPVVADLGLANLLDSGRFHNCGLRPDGSVECWGAGEEPGGQAEDQPGPFVQVTAGDDVSCGLRPDGSVDCWGDSSLGAAEDQAGPFARVVTSGRHTCGLKADGTVECWGANWRGQAESKAGPFSQITLGIDFTCGLRPDGSFTCWGLALDRTGPFVQISAGYLHVCGLRPDGAVNCWGSNDDGQANNQLGPYTQVAAGTSHTCALRPNGSVDCWGNNAYGQAADQAGPFTLVTADYVHSCGLKSDGSVVCWGDNQFGQAQGQPGPFGPIVPTGGSVTRVSLSSMGGEGDEVSYAPALSADGRFVAFFSQAENLDDSGLRNYWFDVFVHDRLTGQTAQVSVDSDGNPGDDFSLFPAISGDGRYIAFMSWSTNLVSDDTNEDYDIFVHDRQTGKTTRVSEDSAGSQANRDSENPAISADGRYVAFHSFANNLDPRDSGDYADVFVHDRQTAETTLVSVSSAGVHGNDGAADPSISADGRYVAYGSIAGNLVQGDTNNRSDIFVYDRQSSKVTRVSVDSAGKQAVGGDSELPAISANGRFVAFRSEAANLVSGDTNGTWDIFVFDRQTGRTTRVSLDSAGKQMIGASDYYLRPAISGDGRYVTFASDAANLVSGDTNTKLDIFVHDRETGQTTRVSANTAGQQGNGESTRPAISGSGRYVAFDSAADNLVPGDTNSAGDIFVSDREFNSGRAAYAIQDFAPAAWYTGLYLADMDGDGYNELLAGNRIASAVEIWRYRPDLDTLVKIDSINLPNQVHDLKTADFDKDGDIDMAVGLRSVGLYYVVNTGEPGSVGSWDVRNLDGDYSLQVLVDDFDGDRNLDIFHGVDYGPIHTFYGNGKGDFAQGASIQDPDTEMRFPRGFNAANVDGDKKLDLIGVDGAFLRAFLNPGNRAAPWTSAGPETPVGDYPCCPTNWLMADVAPSAADFDGNGVVDQVAHLQNRPDGPVKLLLFQGKPSGSGPQWDQQLLYTIDGVGWAGASGVADLDGDGRFDIHFTGAERFNGLRLYFGQANGTFEPWSLPLDIGLGGPNSIAVGDLNMDGAPDIVAARHTRALGQYSGFQVLFATARGRVLLPVVLRP